jgi:hypothetical protein
MYTLESFAHMIMSELKDIDPADYSSSERRFMAAARSVFKPPQDRVSKAYDPGMGYAPYGSTRFDTSDVPPPYRGPGVTTPQQATAILEAESKNWCDESDTSTWCE